MKQLKFTYNWNNKLDCKFFTSFRVWYPNRFKKDQEIEIIQTKGNIELRRFNAKMILSIPVKLKDVPEILCYLDTGYSKEKFIQVVKTMYKNIVNDFDKEMFVFYLIEKL